MVPEDEDAIKRNKRKFNSLRNPGGSEHLKFQIRVLKKEEQEEEKKTEEEEEEEAEEEEEEEGE